VSHKKEIEVYMQNESHCEPLRAFRIPLVFCIPLVFHFRIPLGGLPDCAWFCMPVSVVSGCASIEGCCRDCHRGPLVVRGWWRDGQRCTVTVHRRWGRRESVGSGGIAGHPDPSGGCLDHPLVVGTGACCKQRASRWGRVSLSLSVCLFKWANWWRGGH
jgi:hypothetical protein